MHEYSELISSILSELDKVLNSVDPECVSNLRRDITQARRVFVAGRGRSGLQMQTFAMRLMHLDLDVHVVGDVTAPSIGAGDLLIIGSGSGQTASLVEYAGRARELNAQVALITIAEESPIAQKADSIIHIAAASPKLDDDHAANNPSIQPMGSLFEQALGILLDAVVIQLMADLSIDVEMMFARHANLE
jgi:6-phospho-3-hexuloisomerase